MKPENFITKHGDKILAVLFLLILASCFIGCKSVKKSQHTEVTEATQVAKIDSSSYWAQASQSKFGTQIATQEYIDSSKAIIKTNTTIIEAPVFDSTGRITSAKVITYVGVIEEKQNRLSEIKTDSSAYISKNVSSNQKTDLHKSDSSASKEVVTDSKAKTKGFNYWLLLWLIPVLVAVIWWKRGWIIEKIVTI